VVLTACGSAEAPGDLPASVHVWEQPFVPEREPSVTWVATIDDRDDEQGSQLRSRIKEAFATYLGDLLANRTIVQHPTDEWFDVDLRMVVAHPSFGDWTGPDEDSALRWTTTDANEAGARAFAAAFERAVDARVAPSGLPHRLLETYHRTGLLVSGCDAPRDGHEARLADAAGSGFPSIRLVLATAHDDESAGTPQGYRIESSSTCDGTYRTETSTYAPNLAAPDGRRCTSPADSAWRLARWGSGVSCSDDAAPSALFDGRSWSDGRMPCLSRPIAVDPDGLALCSIQVKNAEYDCPASRGWFDPTGPDGGSMATYVGRPNAGRICELRQLAGDDGALRRAGGESRSSLSGFCRLDQPPRGCFDGTFPTQLRFVGGALAGRFQAMIRCLLAP